MAAHFVKVFAVVLAGSLFAMGQSSAPDSNRQSPADGVRNTLPGVTYKNGQLTVDSTNSTFDEIFQAIQRQTGTEFDVDTPSNERFAGHLSGTERSVLTSILDASETSFVLEGSVQDPETIVKVQVIGQKANVPPVAAPTEDANRAQSSPEIAVPVPVSAQSEEQDPRSTQASQSGEAANGIAGVNPAIPPATSQAESADGSMGATGQFMMNLYKQRLQVQNSGQQQDAK